MVNITKASLNYSFTSQIPMTYKGFPLNKEMVNKGRFIFPFALPFSFTYASPTECIFKVFDQYANKAKEYESVVQKLSGEMLEFLGDEYPNIQFKTVLFDEYFTPIVALSSNNTAFSLTTDTYFDSGKFLIPSHLSRAVETGKVDKNVWGILKLGKNLLFGYNYFNFSVLIVPFLLSYLYSRYGIPNNEKPPMTFESFKFIYSTICAQLDYERVYLSSLRTYYDTLLESKSLPTISDPDMSTETKKFSTLTESVLNLKSGAKVAKQLLLGMGNNNLDNDDNDDYWERHYAIDNASNTSNVSNKSSHKVTEVATEKKQITFIDDQGVESFFGLDAYNLYDLYEKGYSTSLENLTYIIEPMTDFLDTVNSTESILEVVDCDVVMLTPQNITIEGKKRNMLVPKDLLVVGFCVNLDMSFILVFKDTVGANKIYLNNLYDAFVEKYSNVFSSIDFYSEADLKLHSQEEL